MGVWGRAALSRFGPGSRLGCVAWVQTKVNRRSPAVRARARRDSESVWAWLSRCDYFCGITRRVRENKDRFNLNSSRLYVSGQGGFEAASWRPAALLSERAPQGTACIRAGGGAHRDIERGKASKVVPSAARVARMACIARVPCTSQCRYSRKP